jgi:NTE family protein
MPAKVPRGIKSPAALVLCGGSSRGALEVGLYRAIADLALPVDLVVGTSIGALNGAFIAAGVSPEELASLWAGFRRREGLALNYSALLGRSSGLFRLDPLRAWLRRKLPATRFEALRIPLVIATTDLQRGKATYWSGSGDIIGPLIASMSLPGLFPPVEIDGHQLVDGGIVNNLPVDEAVRLGARHLYMISCVGCAESSRIYRGFRDVLARSVSLAIGCRQDADIGRFGGAACMHLVRPGFECSIGLLDFLHSAALIDAGYRETLRYFGRSSSGEGREGTACFRTVVRN